MAWQEVKVKVKTAMNSAEQVASMIQPVILTPRRWFCPEFEDYAFLQVQNLIKPLNNYFGQF